MKRYFKGFYMSLGMFCAIPQPRNLWDESCMNLMLPFFPVTGILIGAIWWGIAELLKLSGIHIILAAAISAVTPFLLSGFLHLDGYMDTSDAVLSRRPLEEKLRILKDPHNGAFSVIMAAILFILQFASVYALLDLGKNLTPLVFIAVISRCCASVSLLSMKAMPQSGYANMFKRNARASHKAFVIALSVLTLAASYLFAGISGLTSALSAAVGYLIAIVCSY
ncbi:MAG: adenosylcobinamide-GDP ribazoletransferase, partial [Oscillospiraceae bacterium]|nr:adenosylcobinamide-GDP ribazoletransferase [Oscillospiraceae bacterium]